MNSFPGLKTERLILRQLKETDAPQIFILRSDESINRFIDRQRAQHIGDALAFIQKISVINESRQAFYWAITTADDDTLIGTVCIWNFNSEKNKAEIGYELLPKFQGKGYMHEALKAVIDFGFENLRLRSIEGWTHPDNTSSSKVLESLGFSRDKEAESMRPAESIEQVYSLSSPNYS